MNLMAGQVGALRRPARVTTKNSLSPSTLGWANED